MILRQYTLTQRILSVFTPPIYDPMTYQPGLDDFTAADEALRQGLQLRAQQEDATHVSMEININIPEVALDLTYDVALARHLVLAVRTLEMQVNDFIVAYLLCIILMPSHLYPLSTTCH